MPELPEVETVARDLDAALRGAEITGVDVRQPVVVAAPGAADFPRLLTGRTVLGVRRRAKFIVCDLSGGLHLVIHLRMTGRLLLQAPGTPPEKHTHAVISLRDAAGVARELHFHDTRRFGRLWLVDADGLAALFAGLGPEPLSGDFTADCLAGLLSCRTTKVKPLHHGPGQGVRPRQHLRRRGALPGRRPPRAASQEPVPR